MVVEGGGVDGGQGEGVESEGGEEGEGCRAGQQVEGGVVDEFGGVWVAVVWVGGIEGDGVVWWGVVWVLWDGEVRGWDVHGEFGKGGTEVWVGWDTARVGAEGEGCVVAGYVL